VTLGKLVLSRIIPKRSGLHGKVKGLICGDVRGDLRVSSHTKQVLFHWWGVLEEAATYTGIDGELDALSLGTTEARKPYGNMGQEVSPGSTLVSVRALAEFASVA
jgi:hypothetical protein